LKREPGWIEVSTIPGYGAFAGRVPLGLDSSQPARLAVHVRARVIHGKVGFGILNSEGKAFLRQVTLRPEAGTSNIVLPLPDPPVIGDLVISNTAPGRVVSKAIVEKIEIEKVPRPPPSQLP
jgi:hypothetical protein